MLNGDGIRVSLWVSGCNHNCNQCQNPQTWNINSGIPFDKDAEKELFEALEKNYISGITFTGGDPLHENNLECVLNLVNKIRLLIPNKTIWLYTGYTWEEIMKYESCSEYIKDENVGYWNCDALRQIIVSKCDILVDSVSRSFIPLGTADCFIRRENMNASVKSVQIPRMTVAQIVIENKRLILRKYSDGINTAVYTV